MQGQCTGRSRIVQLYHVHVVIMVISLGNAVYSGQIGFEIIKSTLTGSLALSGRTKTGKGKLQLRLLPAIQGVQPKHPSCPGGNGVQRSAFSALRN